MGMNLESGMNQRVRREDKPISVNVDNITLAEVAVVITFYFHAEMVDATMIVHVSRC